LSPPVAEAELQPRGGCVRWHNLKVVTAREIEISLAVLRAPGGGGVATSEPAGGGRSRAAVARVVANVATREGCDEKHDRKQKPGHDDLRSFI